MEYQSGRADWVRRRREAVLTQKRQENLARAFHLVEWDFQNAILANYGRIGDRPQFDIPGQLGRWRLRYRHQGPAGSPSSLVVSDENGHRVMHLINVPLCDAAKLQERLLILQRAEERNITVTRKPL